MPSPPPPAPARSPRELLLGTRSGRIFLAAAAIKLLVVIIDRGAGAPPMLNGIGTLAGIVLVLLAALFLARGLLLARRQLLWRVRRKLIVSYVFIGLVPALLLIVFFLFAGQLIFTSVASYLFKTGYEKYQTGAVEIAQAAANDVANNPGRVAEILASKIRNLSPSYPGLSLAVVPITSTSPVPFAQAGAWRHLDAPGPPLPLAVRTDGFNANIVCRTEDGIDMLIARAVVGPEGGAGRFVVIADIPFGQQVSDLVRERTAIRASGVTAAPHENGGVEPPRCRPTAEIVPASGDAATMPFRYDRSIAFFEYVDWQHGAAGGGNASIGLKVRLGQLYAEITKAQAIKIGNVDFARAMLGVVLAIGVLFLIIEIAALVMGLALARSITTAVHELFIGTERVRQGDFTHRIQVHSRDQLGQLSDSFNQMSTSIEHLLQQAAEKRRLEEELRIAREIQMSLLPSASLDMPGVSMTALCVPAREVGGDYYDYFRLSEHRFSLLIADVSGKGTSAALYMAELKGLLLSLSTIYQSPRQLLIEVNRIISDHLDMRSFITMTYAVVDLQARTLVFARAGHTPFVYLPAARAPREARRAQALVPAGMVLGLRVPNIARLFPHHLTEHTIALAAGDVMALYTDGITEAMNAGGDLYGDARLAHIIEQHGHLDVAELRERIIRDVEAFAGAEDQHDDLTMILLKIEEAGARLPAVHTEGIVEP